MLAFLLCSFCDQFSLLLVFQMFKRLLTLLQTESTHLSRSVIWHILNILIWKGKLYWVCLLYSPSESFFPNLIILHIKGPLVFLQMHWAVVLLMHALRHMPSAMHVPLGSGSLSVLLTFTALHLSNSLEFTAIFTFPFLPWHHCCFKLQKMLQITGQKLGETCCAFLLI